MTQHYGAIQGLSALGANVVVSPPSPPLISNSPSGKPSSLILVSAAGEASDPPKPRALLEAP